MTPVELTTARLRLRRWRIDDFEPLAVFLADAELARYRAPVADRFAAWSFMCGQLGQWQLRGYGIFCAALKESDEPIGYTGLFHPIVLDEPEVSWSLFRPYHGQGYATEMAGEILRWTDEDLHRPPPISMISPENTASRKVAERLGAAIEGEMIFLGQNRYVYRHAVRTRTNATSKID